MRQRWRAWQQDRLLRAVIKSSAYLFSSAGVTAVLGLLQGALAARLLGMDGLGVVTAVTTFASNVHRLLSFRMSEVVVRWYGGALEQGQRDQAAAAAKAALLANGLISLLSFGLALLLSPWAAGLFAHNVGFASWFMLYSLALLGGMVYESSAGVLQVSRRFDRLALGNTLQGVFSAAGISLAFILQAGGYEVLLAYLSGKLVNCLLVTFWAQQELRQKLGPDWLRVPLNRLADGRGLLRFGLNTNLHGTVNLLVRDSQPLFINALLSPTEGGYFKIALSLINLITMPVDPLIAPTYTELNSAAARGEWSALRGLLRRITGLAAGWVLAVGGGLALIGWLLIPLIYGAEAAPAYPALLLLLLGYGFAAIFQWNRSLLLAFGLSGLPLLVTAFFGALKTALTLLFTPTLGYLAEAANLALYFILSISLLVWRGLAELRQRERSP